MAERLDLALELKAVDTEQRIIEGYASVFGNEDHNGDIVDPGAFTQTLASHAPSDIPVFIGHKHDELPVGQPLVIRQDANGLFTRTKIFATQAGDDLLSVAKASLSSSRPLGQSIGYNPLDFKWETKADGSMVRHIRALDLGEYSYVAMPANEMARVMAVKERKAAVDNSSWDGAAAMAGCETAADFEAICAGRRAGDPALAGTWALPHHRAPGDPPNAAGTRNALSRLPQTQGLTDKAAAQAHLERHMAAINPDAQAADGRKLALKALTGLDPTVVAALSQLDLVITQADELLDQVLTACGIADDDEGDEMMARLVSLETKAGRRYSSSTAQMLLARLAAARKALDEIEADVKASTEDDGKSTKRIAETKSEPVAGPWDLEIALAKARVGGTWA